MKDSTIIPHHFNDKVISQLSEDTFIHGVLVPKGFCNLTEMIRASDKPGKRLNDYLTNKSTREYIEELEAENLAMSIAEIPAVLLVTVTDDKGLIWGTWADVEIAIDCAKWISAKFRVWANRTLRLVINGDFEALNQEAASAQAKLQEQWQKIRDASKQAFWSLGDAIAEYKENHAERSDKFRAFVFSNCQDCLNRGLFGKDASTIREELGIKSGELLRDHYGQNALRRIDLIQSLAAASIVHRDTEPLVAVKEALGMYSFDVMDYRE